MNQLLACAQYSWRTLSDKKLIFGPRGVCEHVVRLNHRHGSARWEAVLLPCGRVSWRWWKDAVASLWSANADGHGDNQRPAKMRLPPCVSFRSEIPQVLPYIMVASEAWCATLLG
jgi:hypothetical protein